LIVIIEMGCAASTTKTAVQIEAYSTDKATSSCNDKPHEFLKGSSFTEISPIYRANSILSANSINVRSLSHYLNNSVELSNQLSSSVPAVSLFARFLKAHTWLDELLDRNRAVRSPLSLIHPSKLQSSNNRSIKFHEYTLFSQNELSSYIDDENIVAEASGLMMNWKLREAEEAVDFDVLRKTIVDYFSPEGFQALLIAVALPKFIASEEYRQAAASNWLIDVESVQFTCSNASFADKQRDPHRNLKDLCQGVIESWNMPQLVDTISSSSWVTVLERDVDNLNFSTTIVAYDKDEKAWSIDYANDAFEQLTGYRPAEVAGREVTFLQCDSTNLTQIKMINSALLDHEPCKAAIINRHKRGYEFCNMLALQPVFERRSVASLAFTRKCTHFIAIHYNINQQGATVHDLEIISDLILLLSVTL